MVKWVKISEIAKIKRGKRLVKSQLAKVGKYPVYQNSLTPLGYYNDFNVNSNTTFVISAGNAGEIGYSISDFWAADDCLFIEGDNVVFSKYLYYFLLIYQTIIKSNVRKASVPRLSKSVIENIEIPLPSLSEQQRIVDILDKFEGMVENVEKELLLRQKQYEVYREKVIFSIPIIKRACRLSGVTKILRGKRLTKKELSDNNKYPVYHGGIEPIGRYNDYNRNADTIMIINVGASAGTVGFCNEKFWSSDGSFCIEKTDKVIDKYLYYYLLCKEHDIKSQVRYAGIPTLDQAVIENIEIPLPYLDKQQEIVEKLDKFEEMISTLKRELELRKKQYEYYREKLLTFEY